MVDGPILGPGNPIERDGRQSNDSKTDFLFYFGRAERRRHYLKPQVVVLVLEGRHLLGRLVAARAPPDHFVFGSGQLILDYLSRQKRK